MRTSAVALSCSGWSVMVIKSIDAVSCRYVLEPQTSRLTGLPTNGTRPKSGSLQHSMRATGPPEGVTNGTLSLKDGILSRIHIEVAVCVSKLLMLSSALLFQSP